MTGLPGGGGGALTPIPNNTVLGNTSGGVAFPQALTTLPTGLTIPSPVFSGTVTGAYTLGGTPTFSAPAFTSTVLANGGNLFIGGAGSAENAGAANVSGTENTYLGDKAGNAAIGSFNTATGHNAYGNGGSCTPAGSGNSYYGYDSGRNVCGGNNNSVFGGNSGINLTVNGNANTIAGQGSGNSLTNTANNSIFGQGSGINSTGSSNSIFGAGAGTTPVSGNSLVIVGAGADVNGNVNNSTIVGASARGGSQHVSVGTSAGASTLGNVSGVYVGFQSGQFVSTGTGNTFGGWSSGQGITGTKLTGANNSAWGQQSGLLLQGAANSNSLFGSLSGSAITTGARITALGSGVGAGGTGCVTATDVLLLGTSNATDCASTSEANTIHIGAGGSDIIKSTGTGTPSTSVTTIAGLATITGAATLSTAASDATHTDATLCRDTTSGAILTGSGAAGICLGTSAMRFKRDIQPLDVGLAQIMGLEAVKYYPREGHGDPSKQLYGFVADQGQYVLPKLAGYDEKGEVNTFDYMGVVPVLVKAIQEQQREIEKLKARAQ